MIGCRYLLLLLVVSGCQIDSRVGSNALQARDASPTIDAPNLAACGDRMDNDGDSAIDYPFDPGCLSASDTSEEDPSPLPLCANAFDDDGDGITDFPLDPGCESASDADESDPPITPQCADGIDNDGNGETDYPEDIGCYAAGDPEESSVTS